MVAWPRLVRFILIMPSEKCSYVDVDKLLPQVPSQAAAKYYGFPLPDTASDRELRLPCPFDCADRSENPRAIAVNLQQPQKPLICHQYQCSVRGNLLSLMFAMKHRRLPTGGKLKGREFKEMATDLQAIANGEAPPVPPSPARLPQKARPANAPAEPARTVSISDIGAPASVAPATALDLQPNVPLRLSDNERARDQENLDQHFVTDVAEMSPDAAKYFRTRRWLTRMPLSFL